MTHNDDSRKTVYAKLCAPGAEALRVFCLSHGVSVAAFLDGLSHVLCPMKDASMGDLEGTTPALATALRHARIIDAERRRREPPSSGRPVGGAGPPQATGLSRPLP